MKPKDYDVRRFLEGSGIDEAREKKGAQALLRLMEEHPEAMARIEAPAGYEDHLLKSLRARLPAPKVIKEERRESLWGFLWRFHRLAVGSMASFAILAAFTLYMLRQSEMSHLQSVAQSQDILLNTAKRLERESLERWLASVGDSTALSVEGTVGQHSAKDLEEALQKIEGEIHSL